MLINLKRVPSSSLLGSYNSLDTSRDELDCIVLALRLWCRLSILQKDRLDSSCSRCSQMGNWKLIDISVDSRSFTFWNTRIPEGIQSSSSCHKAVADLSRDSCELLCSLDKFLKFSGWAGNDPSDGQFTNTILDALFVIWEWVPMLVASWVFYLYTRILGGLHIFWTYSFTLALPVIEWPTGFGFRFSTTASNFKGGSTNEI